MEEWLQILLFFASVSILSGGQAATPPHPITFTPVSNISRECASGLATLEAGLRDGGMWAFKMIDSSGKPGAGFFQGNFLWLGRFSECEQAGMPGGTKFYVIYSALTMDPGGQMEGLTSPNPLFPGQKEGQVQGRQGVCLPASCKEEDASLLALEAIDAIDHFLGSVNVTSVAIEYESVMDASEDKDFFGSIYAVSRFCAILIFVLVVVMATILDLLGYEDIALHPYQELRELEIERKSEVEDEEVSLKTDRSEITPSPSFGCNEAGQNTSFHDTIEVITVDENEPITKNASGLLEKEDSEKAVKGEEDDVEKEEADVVAVNGGTLEEKTADEELTGAAVEQIHVVEVHIECSDPSSDESPQNSDVDPTNRSLTPPVASPQNPDPLDGSLLPPVLAGSTKTPPNTPRRKVCLFLAELKDTAGKNL